MMKRQKIKQFDEPFHHSRYYKDKDSGSSGEETELFIKNSSPKRHIPSIEKQVEAGDTLQSLAIRYRCTIEDLKRLNNIHKENEIFARRTIKVPHHPLSEALATVPVHTRGSTAAATVPPNEPTIGNLIDIESPSTSTSEPAPIQKQSVVNEIVFNSNIVQKPPERACEDFATEATEEEIHLLPNHSQITEADQIISKLNCNGADCDIPWVALIIIVVLMFAVSLILVIYRAEHLDKFHHNNHSS